jgi:hypothetical protein
LIALHVADKGGEENVSESERAIIKRAATLIVECEIMEGKFALAEGASERALDLYGRTANTLRRLLETIGLQRRARDVTTLVDYLGAKPAAAPAAPAGAVLDVDVAALTNGDAAAPGADAEPPGCGDTGEPPCEGDAA